MQSRYQQLTETRLHPPMSLDMPGMLLEAQMQMTAAQRREDRVKELRAERALETRPLSITGDIPVLTQSRLLARAAKSVKECEHHTPLVDMERIIREATERLEGAHVNARRTPTFALSVAKAGRGEIRWWSNKRGLKGASKKPPTVGVSKSKGVRWARPTAQAASSQNDANAEDCIQVTSKAKTQSATALGKRRAVDGPGDQPDDEAPPSRKRRALSRRSTTRSPRAAAPARRQERAISVFSSSSIQISDQPFTQPPPLREARASNNGSSRHRKNDSKVSNNTGRPSRQQFSNASDYFAALGQWNRLRRDDDSDATDDPSDSEPSNNASEGPDLCRWKRNEAYYQDQMKWLAERTNQGCIPDLEAAIAGTKEDARRLWDTSTTSPKMVLQGRAFGEEIIQETQKRVGEAWRTRIWLVEWAKRFERETPDTVVEPVCRPADWQTQSYWQVEVNPLDIPTMATWTRETGTVHPNMQALVDRAIPSQHGPRQTGALSEPESDVPTADLAVLRLQPADVQRGDMPQEVHERLVLLPPRRGATPSTIERTEEVVHSQQPRAITVFLRYANPHATFSDAVDLDAEIFD